METNDQLHIRPDDYKATVDIRQLDRSGEPIKVFKLHGAFPSDIASIDLSFDNDDTIQDFDITWNYDYFTTDFNTAQLDTAIEAGSFAGS
jgi:hypothetical protein